MNREIIVTKETPTGIWFRFAVNTVAIYLTGWLLSGVEVRGVLGAVLAALVLTLVNTFVRPILFFLTLPITILTLGLFIFVLNGLTLLLAAWIAGDAFSISGIGSAILAWIVFSLLNWAITGLFKRERTIVKDRT
jgi:putative membrane protein